MSEDTQPQWSAQLRLRHELERMRTQLRECAADMQRARDELMLHRFALVALVLDIVLTHLWRLKP